jgi:hypothetical protein
MKTSFQVLTNYSFFIHPNIPRHTAYWQRCWVTYSKNSISKFNSMLILVVRIIFAVSDQPCLCCPDKEQNRNLRYDSNIHGHERDGRKMRSMA